MRNRLYLLAVLVCVFALSSTTWSYDRNYQIRVTTNSAQTNEGGGNTTDDHPWGEDQSFGQPVPDPNAVRTSVSAIARIDMFLLQSQMYFINMFRHWPVVPVNTIQSGTTDVVTTTTTNSTTACDGVR